MIYKIVKKILPFLLVVLFALAVYPFSKTLSFSVFLFSLFFLYRLYKKMRLFLYSFLNGLLKETNWYQNHFRFADKFVNDVEYRTNIIRNYEVVNVGSNPALYGFFYEDIVGQNWATGSQGPDMDFEILKLYHSYLKKGGVILIPIMPFSSISIYIKGKINYWGPSYYAKFLKILQESQIPQEMVCAARDFMNNPLAGDRSRLKYIFHDCESNDYLGITGQIMSAMDLEQDACKWIKSWLDEFDLHSLEEVLGDRFKNEITEGVRIYRSMIDFCLEREYRPVIILMPMEGHLLDKFDEELLSKLYYDFVNQINHRKIEVLDYIKESSFSHSSLYLNSLFMNLEGRKQLTRQVLNDLGVIKCA